MDIAIRDSDSNHWPVSRRKSREAVLDGIHRSARSRENAA
jgi:hypothetical protein